MNVWKSTLGKNVKIPSSLLHLFRIKRKEWQIYKVYSTSKGRLVIKKFYAQETGFIDLL